MVEYLPDKDFGVHAANVLAEQWREANEPGTGGWRTSPDYSRVAAKRAARKSQPEGSCREADAIFDAAEALLGRGATDADRRHAVALTTAAASLPHGQRTEEVAALVEVADHQRLNALLHNLVLSGEPIDAEWVKGGIAELLKIAEKDAYALRETWQMGVWLRLLPFTDRPRVALEIVRELPDRLREPRWLEELVSAFPYVPGKNVEAVFFQLAKSDVRLYMDRAWIESAFAFGTLSSGEALVPLVTEGTLKGGGGVDEWRIVNEMARLIGTHSELRGQVYGRFANGGSTRGTALLARAVAENPDEAGLRALMDLEEATGQRFISSETITQLVAKHVPDRELERSL